MNTYSDFYNLVGDTFNIEAVCPNYLPERQWGFTWRRDGQGVAIVSGYDPEDDPSAHWLCDCGNFITDGCCHCTCGAEAPWGCDCGLRDEDGYDEDMDFGFEFDPYEGTYEPAYDYDGMPPEDDWSEGYPD